MAAPTSLWAFEGHWTLNREIADHSGGPDGVFQGNAVFARAGQHLDYQETGTLALGEATPMVATRRFIWRQERGCLQIDYDDGRPFHGVPFGVDEPEATHLCAPDRYEVAYDFKDWPSWTARWQVSGPRKDYVMISRYTRKA